MGNHSPKQFILVATPIKKINPWNQPLDTKTLWIITTRKIAISFLKKQRQNEIRTVLFKSCSESVIVKIVNVTIIYKFKILICGLVRVYKHLVKNDGSKFKC